jgi:hypothetical protein
MQIKSNTKLLENEIVKHITNEYQPTFWVLSKRMQDLLFVLFIYGIQLMSVQPTVYYINAQLFNDIFIQQSVQSLLQFKQESITLNKCVS